MKNVTATVTGTKLTIEVDLTQDLGPSNSGKTNIVASTEGNAKVEATLPGKRGKVEFGYGLNVWYKTPAPAK